MTEIQRMMNTAESIKQGMNALKDAALAFCSEQTGAYDTFEESLYSETDDRWLQPYYILHTFQKYDEQKGFRNLAFFLYRVLDELYLQQQWAVETEDLLQTIYENDERVLAILKDIFDTFKKAVAIVAAYDDKLGLMPKHQQPYQLREEKENKIRELVKDHPYCEEWFA